MNILDSASNLIAPLGSGHFLSTFFKEARNITDCDQCNIFYFDRDFRPSCILSTASEASQSALTRACASEYVSHGYRRDPTLRLANEQSSSNAFMYMRHLQAEEISDSYYRDRFYLFAKVGQKSSVIMRNDQGLYYLNFYRNPDRDALSKGDMVRIADAGRILSNLVARHHGLIGQGGAGMNVATSTPRDLRVRMVQRIRQALVDQGAGLTGREADICAAIVSGQTTVGIGLEFDLSINTVSTHRKRAYAKLGISCQNELFALYYAKVERYLN